MENEFKVLRSVTEMTESLSETLRQSNVHWNQKRIEEMQKSYQWSSNIQITVKEMQKSFRQLERVSQNLLSKQLQKQLQEISLGLNFDWSEPIQNAIRESSRLTNLITTNIGLSSNVIQQMMSQTIVVNALQNWQFGHTFKEIDISYADTILEDVLEEVGDVDVSKVSHSPEILNQEQQVVIIQMTAEEVRKAFYAAETAESKNKDRAFWRPIYSYLVETAKTFGQDKLIWIFETMIVPLLIRMLIGISFVTYNFEVAQQITEQIDPTARVTEVRKAFEKNPEINRPVGNMGFLRIDSHLRTRPTKQSHIASEQPVQKNTVVIPIERKGNWVLVETESRNGHYYIGWIEESKVIKFKLDSSVSSNKS